MGAAQMESLNFEKFYSSRSPGELIASNTTCHFAMQHTHTLVSHMRNPLSTNIIAAACSFYTIKALQTSSGFAYICTSAIGPRYLLVTFDNLGL